MHNIPQMVLHEEHFHELLSNMRESSSQKYDNQVQYGPEIDTLVT